MSLKWIVAVIISIAIIGIFGVVGSLSYLKPSKLSGIVEVNTLQAKATQDQYLLSLLNIGEKWDSQLIQSGGRIDAIEYLGNGVVIAGTRDSNPGRIFRSADYGKTWEFITNIENNNITNIKSAGGGEAYLLTGNSYLWRTTDYGRTWSKIGSKISKNTALKEFQLSYGLMITDSGTLLVSDTKPTGGHVFRSEDGGENWADLGSLGSSSQKQPLYRFEKTGDGIVVNGWNGRIFKTTDDGKNWVFKVDLSSSPLYATEYLGNGILLQGTDSGRIVRSADNGETWANLGSISKGGADDFVYLGNGAVIYSTYNADKNLFYSTDFGQTWSNIGSIATESGDSWEHEIYINNGENQIGIGGTNKGYILRIVLPSQSVCSAGPIQSCIDSVSPHSVKQGQTITFTGSAKVDDPSKVIAKYRWRIDPSVIQTRICKTEESAICQLDTSTIPIGVHTVYFRVGTPKILGLKTEWSDWTARQFIIK